MLLTGGVFECDIAHRPSVAVVYILFKIMCNLLHSLFGALPVPPVVGGALWEWGEAVGCVECFSGGLGLGYDASC